MTYLIKRSCLSLVCMVLSLCAIAQPTFTFDDKSANTGDLVSIECRVDDFADLIGITYSVQYDTLVARLESISSITPELQGIVFAAPPAIKQGRVSLSWFNQGNPTTIANGSLFFTMNFRVVGAVGTSTPIEFNPDRLIEAARDVNGVPTNIGANQVQGSIRVLGGGAPDPTVRIATRTVDPGQRVCLPVTVQDFVDVRALQYDISWDASVLSFDAIENLNLQDLDANDFNTTNASSGTFAQAWTTAAPDGVSLADGTVIYNICFDAIGSAGSSTAVSFSNIISSPDISTINGRATMTGTTTEGLAFIIDQNAMGPLGGEQCLDVKVNDFVNVSSFQFSFAYDPTMAQFVEFKNVLPEFQAVLLFGESPPLAPGKLSATWFDLAGTTLVNGTTIFSICFTDINKDCGDTYEVAFSDDPTPIVISTTDRGQLDPSEYTLVNGLMTLTCGVNLDVDSKTDVLCNGDLTGAIFTTITPPGDYSITLNGEASVEDPSGLAAGQYTMVVTDNTDPTNSATQVINILQPDAISINGNAIDALAGMNNGSISELMISGGVAPYSCTWDNVLLSDCNGGGDLPCGDYTITVTDNNKCETTRTFTVGCGEVSLSVSTTPNSCHFQDEPDCDGTLTASATGVGPYTFTINGDAFDGTADGLCAGDYVIVVTDQGDNNQTASQTVNVSQPISPLEVIIESTDPSEIGLMNGSIIVNSVAGGTPPYNILIDGIETDSLLTLGQGTYAVVVTDAAGCQKTNMISIGELPPDCFVGLPAITPNGDGRNDFLTITCVQGVTDNELNIFNRWGQLVYRAQNYDQTWSGTDFVSQALPEDVYFWVLSVTIPDGSREVTGYVNLIRDIK